jgi:hypothetical protein
MKQKVLKTSYCRIRKNSMNCQENVSFGYGITGPCRVPNCPGNHCQDIVPMEYDSTGPCSISNCSGNHCQENVSDERGDTKLCGAKNCGGNHCLERVLVWYGGTTGPCSISNCSGNHCQEKVLCEFGIGPCGDKNCPGNHCQVMILPKYGSRYGSTTGPCSTKNCHKLQHLFRGRFLVSYMRTLRRKQLQVGEFRKYSTLNIIPTDLADNVFSFL